jgi:membrane-associated phospholipid phosphatase
LAGESGTAGTMKDALLAPGLETTIQEVRLRLPLQLVRRSEWIILAFLLYTQTIALILPAAPPVRSRVTLLSWIVISTYGFLIILDSKKPTLAVGIIRDWLPLGFVLFAYREMGWFALPHRAPLLESHWIVWDRWILRGGGKAVIEAFGPALPSVLEIAYSLVYAIAPFCVAVLYLYGFRHRVDAFLTVFLLGVLLCYAQFPFWPSEPPRVVFFGEDVPFYDTVFRRFNWWMLGSYGIHTSVFPSAHVGGAFAAALGLRQAMPSHKRVTRLLFLLAVLIAISTVYGRYHYLADAVAGSSVAALVAALGGFRRPAFKGVAFRSDTRERCFHGATIQIP